MNTKTEFNHEALTDEALNEVAGGWSFTNFMLGRGDPRIGQFRAAAITVAAFAAPGVIGAAASAIRSLKFW